MICNLSSCLELTQQNWKDKYEILNKQTKKYFFQLFNFYFIG